MCESRPLSSRPKSPAQETPSAPSDPQSPDHRRTACEICGKRVIWLRRHIQRMHRDQTVASKRPMRQQRGTVGRQRRRAKSQGVQVRSVGVSTEDRPLRQARKPVLTQPTFRDEDFDKAVREIFKGDNLQRIIEDPIFYMWARDLWERTGFRKTGLVKDRMLLAIKLDRKVASSNETGAAKLVDLFYPAGVDILIPLIKTFAGYFRGEYGLEFERPRRAIYAFRLVNDLAQLKLDMAMRDGDAKAERSIRIFIHLFTDEGSKKIYKYAVQNCKRRLLEKRSRLPSTFQIAMFYQYLLKETPELAKTLKAEVTEIKWRRLAENILTRLTVFNRRWGGCIQQMTVKQFTERKTFFEEDTDGFFEYVTPGEKKLLDSYYLVKVIYREHLEVNVYVSKYLDQLIQLLVETRESGGIQDDNPYVFARRSSSAPLNGSKILSAYTKKMPFLTGPKITATSLRMHGAALAKVLKLTGAQKEDWIRHLGHRRETQRRYQDMYERLSVVIRNLKFLKALESGKMKYYRGLRPSQLPAGDDSSNDDAKETEEEQEEETTNSESDSEDDDDDDDDGDGNAEEDMQEMEYEEEDDEKEEENSVDGENSEDDTKEEEEEDEVRENETNDDDDEVGKTEGDDNKQDGNVEGEASDSKSPNRRVKKRVRFNV